MLHCQKGQSEFTPKPMFVFRGVESIGGKAERVQARKERRDNRRLGWKRQLDQLRFEGNKKLDDVQKRILPPEDRQLREGLKTIFNEYENMNPNDFLKKFGNVNAFNNKLFEDVHQFILEQPRGDMVRWVEINGFKCSVPGGTMRSKGDRQWGNQIFLDKYQMVNHADYANNEQYRERVESVSAHLNGRVLDNLRRGVQSGRIGSMDKLQKELKNAITNAGEVFPLGRDGRVTQFYTSIYGEIFNLKIDSLGNVSVDGNFSEVAIYISSEDELRDSRLHRNQARLNARVLRREAKERRIAERYHQAFKNAFVTKINQIQSHSDDYLNSYGQFDADRIKAELKVAVSGVENEMKRKKVKIDYHFLADLEGSDGVPYRMFILRVNKDGEVNVYDSDSDNFALFKDNQY